MELYGKNLAHTAKYGSDGAVVCTVVGAGGNTIITTSTKSKIGGNVAQLKNKT